jgi:hypothetical protein
MKDFNFGAFLGDRYKNYTNIIWHVGQDFQTWNTSSDLNDVVQLVAGIASADPNHLIIMAQLNYYGSYSTQVEFLQCDACGEPDSQLCLHLL